MPDAIVRTDNQAGEGGVGPDVIFEGVQDIAALAAIGPEDRKDKQIILVEDEGVLYRFDQEDATADGDPFPPTVDTDGVVKPADDPATGRWRIVNDASSLVHNTLSGLQGGSASERFHMTAAQNAALHSHSNQAVLDALTSAGSGSIITAAERSNLPTTAQNAALVGTGTPGAGDLYVNDSDSRMTDARAPTNHAANHTDGTDDIQDATAAQKGLVTAAQITKLDGIDTGATDDQTGAEIKVAYEAEVNTNAYTDAEKSKLGGIEASAKDDQTAAEVVNTPAGDIAATDVQAAINELDSEKATLAHASQHQNGGADEVATATPAANAIPKAGTGGDLAVGWIPEAAKEEIFTWVFNGTLPGSATATDGGRIARRAGTIIKATIFMEDRGGSGSSIADINKHIVAGVITTQRNATAGVTIYTTQGNRPTIAGGANTENAVFETVTPDVTSFLAGDFFTMDIDQRATGAFAAGIVVQLHVKYDS